MKRLFAVLPALVLALAACQHPSADLTAARALGISGPVTEAQARAIATQHVPGTARSARRESEGKDAVYEVLVATSDGAREVAVRLSDGAVVDVEKADAAGEADEANGRAEADEEEDESDEPGEAAEQKMEPGALPAAVRDAVRAAYPGATITGAAMESEGGTSFYEAETVEGTGAAALHRDLLLHADGRIAEVEESVDEAALPQAVRDALAARHAGGTVAMAERVTRGSAVVYEIHVRTGSSTAEVVLDAAGRPATLPALR